MWKLFADEDVEHDNESDISDEDDSQSESELSVSELEDEDSENSHTEELRDKAYLPCAAHNLQLVIKEGLKLSDEYTSLLNRVSKEIVSKSAFSSIICDSLRSIGKSLLKIMWPAGHLYYSWQDLLLIYLRLNKKQ